MSKAILSSAAAALLVCAVFAGAAGAGSCDGIPKAPSAARIDAILDIAAIVHGLDPELLSAMAHVESGKCPYALSPKGAAGLMQLMPETAHEYGVSNRFDPAQNAVGAARFIEHLQESHAGSKLSLPEIIAAYNAGESAVRKANGVPDYAETQDYVKRVLWLYFLGVPPRESSSRPKVSGRRWNIATVSSAATRTRRDSDAAILEKLARMRAARTSELSSGN